MVFFGNGPFAAPILARLHADGVALAGVVARPDRPAGKKMTIVPGPVAALAGQLGLPLEQPDSANAAEFVAALAARGADLLVVADFGQILSPACLSATRLGGVNLHGSLLPKFRGAAPVARALLAGETETGVTAIRMSPRMDAGDILGIAATPIGPDETAGELEARLALMAAELAADVVRRLSQGIVAGTPQDPALVSKAPKLAKEDGRVRWDRSPQQVHDQVRAMQPWPGAFCGWRRVGAPPLRLLVLKTRPAPEHAGGPPGTVVEASERLFVAAATGAVELLSVQPAGKAAMPAAAFLRGYRIPLGASLAAESA